MAVCSICSKGKMAGRHIRHRHSGLWERKAPAKPRLFMPNIQKRAVSNAEGKHISIKLCTKCLKRIRNFPGWKGFRIPTVKQTSPVA
jgi:ribosomal protein L28